MTVGRDTVVSMSEHKHFRAPESVYTRVELDDSQRAVLALAGGESAAIVGAPGSGKTATLIEFVADRVESGAVSVAGVLVLAPQRLAANKLRLALAERLHIPTNGPLARTPMSVAFSLAADGAFARGVEPPRMLTGAEHDQLLADLLADASVSALWAPTLEHEVVQSQTFRTELRDLLARCIESGIDHVELAARGAAQNRPEWVAAARFWHGPLENALAFNRVNDFDAATLMRQAAVALADPRVMSEVKLVVVDDAQELTRGAINLLRAFAARHVSVVIFGDPDTAATTFRGGTPRILGSFAAEVAPGAKTLALSHIHRHGQNIRAAMAKLTPHIGTALAVEHRSAQSSSTASTGTVTFVERDSFVAEISAVGRLLREHHVYENVPFKRMAVVVRTGSLVPEVARVLTAGEIPTRTLASDNNLRDKSITRDLLNLVSVGLNRALLTSELAHQLLTSPLAGLSVIDVRRLRQILRHAEIMTPEARSGDQLLIAELLSAGGFSDIDTLAAKAAARLASTIAALSALAETGASIEELLWLAWSTSPVAKSWPKESRTGGILGQEANRNLDAVLELFTMAKRAVEREPDRPAADFIASVLRAELPEDTLAARSESDAVLVCTPAAVIGAEYEIVAVSAVQEGIWPNLRLRGSLMHAPAINDEELPTDDQRQQVRSDELRMFALAISRPTRHLIVSGVSGAEQLVSPFARYIEPLATLPGGEINEATNRSTYPLTLRGIVGHQRRALTAAIKEHGEHSTQARQAAASLAYLAAHEVAAASPDAWYGLKGVSTELPVALLNGEPGETVYVSPSKLEKWQDNQLAWFLSTTVGYEGSASTGIGSLLHSVFEHAAKQPEGMLFTGGALWSEIQPRWKELEFEAVWEGEKEQRRVELMCESLAVYLNKFSAEGKRVVGVESSFRVEVGKGVLQGRADRLEAPSAGISGGIEVVDLKSSKTPKSDNDAKVDMQLACYQYAVVSGGFKFVDGMAVETDRENPEDKGPFAPQKSAGAKLLYLNNVSKKVGPQ
ncbi:MAG: hypothetical protein RLZZ600_1052, partial [Actinomycetota bacterium]